MFFIQEFIITISVIVFVMFKKFPDKKHRLLLLTLLLFVYRDSFYICMQVLVWLSKILTNGDCRNTSTKFLTNNILVRKTDFINNFENKIPNKNTIYVANYPWNEIEYLAQRLIPGNVCGVAFDSFVGRLIRLTGSEEDFIVLPYKKGSTYELLRDKIKSKIKTMSIFGYVENCHLRLTNNEIGLPLRSGLFEIAKELNITITPIFISHQEYKYGKISDRKTFRMEVGETYTVDDPVMIRRKVTSFLRAQKQLR